MKNPKIKILLMSILALVIISMFTACEDETDTAEVEKFVAEKWGGCCGGLRC